MECFFAPPELVLSWDIYGFLLSFKHTSAQRYSKYSNSFFLPGQTQFRNLIPTQLVSNIHHKCPFRYHDFASRNHQGIQQDAN